MLNLFARQAAWFKELVTRLGVIGAIRYRAAEIFRRPAIRVSIDGISLWVRPRTPDLRVATASIGDEFDELCHYLPEDFDGVIVDAGSYIGSAALKLTTMYPNATILCIEPSTENFAILERNVLGKRNIRIVRAALTASGKGCLPLMDRGTGQWGFTTIVQPADCSSPANLETVDTISLSDVVSMFKEKDIGLIKLDIEGAEKSIFSECLPDLEKIPLVFVELHDKIVEGCTEEFQIFSKERTVVSFGGEKFLSFSEPDVSASLDGCDRSPGPDRPAGKGRDR